MTFDQLRSDLADLAQEATIVDLRDRSLAVSRRIGVGAPSSSAAPP